MSVRRVKHEGWVGEKSGPECGISKARQEGEEGVSGEWVVTGEESQ